SGAVASTVARALSRGGALLAPQEALRLVLERVRPAGTEPVRLAESLDRVLAQAVVCAEDVPGFDNSAMDGYAVRAADTQGAGAGTPVRLGVAGESRAGSPAAAALAAGEAFTISTGAMLPTGADAVVRVEDTSREGDSVAVLAQVRPGTDVRRAGDDV